MERAGDLDAETFDDNTDVLESHNRGLNNRSAGYNQAIGIFIMFKLIFVRTIANTVIR